MFEYHREVAVDRPSADIEALLAARPSGWLRSFLQLAVRHPEMPQVPARPWYRIGRPVPGNGGVVSATLTWWPHREDPLFSRFSGAIEVEPRVDASIVRLQGRAVGGQPQVNAAVLDSLLRMVTDAVAASFSAN